MSKLPQILEQVAVAPMPMPATAPRTAVKPAVCNNAPKAGTVQLFPNGTRNAATSVEFDVPFCTGPVIVTATVNNHNTPGEKIGAQAIGLTGVAISMQLDEPSDDTFDVYWTAVKGTQ